VHRHTPGAQVIATYATICMFRFGCHGESRVTEGQAARWASEAPETADGPFWTCLVTDHRSAQRASYRLECEDMASVHR
jgi:hypothetical protein